MPRVLQDSKGNSITISDQPFKSGKGGEGAVHPVISPKTLLNHCVKIYTRPQGREQKLKYMIANPPSKLQDTSYMICWPKEVLYENRKFVGFIMPAAYPGHSKLYDLCSPKTPPNAPKHWAVLFDRASGAGVAARMKLCVNVAIAVHSIHSMSDYVLVDFKPQNVLVSPDGKIALIDIDSLQISQGDRVLYPGRVNTLEYSPPESAKLDRQKRISRSWDEFSLAVVMYQVLFGLHPYAATPQGQYENMNTLDQKISSGLWVHGTKTRFIKMKPPLHNNFSLVPQSVQILFQNAFDGNPNTRPSAERWGKTIFEELTKVAHVSFPPPAKSTARPKPTSTSLPVTPPAPVPPVAKPAPATQPKAQPRKLSRPGTGQSIFWGLIMGIVAFLVGVVTGDVSLFIVGLLNIRGTEAAYIACGVAIVSSMLTLNKVYKRQTAKVNGWFVASGLSTFVLFAWLYISTLPNVQFSDGSILSGGPESLYYLGFIDSLLYFVDLLL